tara:strand:+ start:208 stop:1002 length:795 start_codon:yes stop_codon:yes gene_type:complete
MDFKEIKNTKHYLYDNRDEFLVHMPDSVVRHNWRHGQEGEWVFTDDGFVCQILRKTNVTKNTSKRQSAACIRTVCGTFLAKDLNREMLGEEGIPDNIYTFSGKDKKEPSERGTSAKEVHFTRYAAEYKCRNGVLDAKGSIEAYKLAYPEAKSDKYIKNRCEKLLKTERIDNMINKETRKKLEEEGVTDNWLIERYKTIADLSESDTPKLRALDSLARISGLFESSQVRSEKVEIWGGFSPEQLEGVKKHGKSELIAHAEKDKDD